MNERSDYFLLFIVLFLPFFLFFVIGRQEAKDWISEADFFPISFLVASFFLSDWLGSGAESWLVGEVVTAVLRKASGAGLKG